MYILFLRITSAGSEPRDCLQVSDLVLKGIWVRDFYGRKTADCTFYATKGLDQ